MSVPVWVTCLLVVATVPLATASQRVCVMREFTRIHLSRLLLVLLVVGEITGTVRYIHANCPGTSDHDENPFVSSCTESDITWESQTTVSYVDANGTSFDYNNLFVRSRSATGGCVRNCGTITSTETDPDTGAQTERNLDFLTHPPIFPITTQRGGDTPQRSMQFSTIVCDRSAASIATSAYNTNDTVANVYLDSLAAAVNNDAEIDEGRRRLSASYAADVETFTAMPLHEDVAEEFHGVMHDAWLQYRVGQVMHKGSREPVKNQLHHHMRLDSDVFVHRKDVNSDAVLASMPAIEPSTWTAAEAAVAPGGVTDKDALTAVVSLAIAKQRSKLAYIRDVYSGAAGGWVLAAIKAGDLRINPETALPWTLADELKLMRDVADEMDPKATPSEYMIQMFVKGVELGMFVPKDARHHGQRRLIGVGAVALGVAVTALAVGTVALGIGSAALAQADENRNAINQNARKLDAMEEAMNQAAVLAAQTAGTAEAALAMAEASRDNARAVQGVLEAQAAQQAAVAAQVTQTSEGVTDLYDKLATQAAMTNNRLNRASEERQALADAQAAQAQATETALQSTYDTLSAQIQTMVDSLRAQDEILSTFVQETTATVMGNLARVDHRVTVNTATLRSLAATVYNLNKRDNARRLVSRAAHTIWSLLGPNYWDGFRVDSPSEANEPDPASYWAAGSPHRRLEVDTITAYTVRKTTGSGPDVYGGGLNHELREETYNVVCDAAEIIGTGMPWWEADDLAEFMGPNENCFPLDAMPVGGIDQWVTDHIDVQGNSDWDTRAAGRPGCKCWMEKSVSTCDIGLADAEDRPITRGSATITVDGDPIVVDDSKHLSKSGLTGLGAGDHDPCGADTPVSVTLTEDESLITSFEEFAAEVASHCDVPDGRDYSGLDSTAFEKAGSDAVDALPLGVAYFSSERLSALLSDNSYTYVIGTSFANASYCGWDAESREAAGGALLPSAVWGKLLSDGWKAAYPTLRAKDVQRYGMLEADTNIEELPFVFDDTTFESFPCWRVSSVATQGGMEPVYALRPEGIQKRAEMWMAPVEPSESGAADGRPAVHITQSDPEISIDMDFLLAKLSDYKFVGDPWCMFVNCPRPEVGWYANGTDSEVRYLYDLPANLVSLADEAGLRAGTATYLLDKNTTGSSASYTLSDWEEQHVGEIFDPKLAGADIAGFFREVVQTPGGHGVGDVTCRGEPHPGDGPLCTFLEHFYFLVPDIVVDGEDVTGAHAYLHGTPAAQCAVRSTGALCAVPRDWQAESQVTTPVGEVAATLGASCPMVNDQLLSFTGLPTLSVTNPGSVSTEWYWDLVFLAPNATLDSEQVTSVYEGLSEGSPHPCEALSLTNQDGGVLAPRSTVNMQSAISQPLSQCAQWTLTISITDPRTLLRKPCLEMNITKNIGEGVTTILNVPAIDFTLNDTETATTVNTIVIPTTADLALANAVALEYIINNMPGGKPAFNAYTDAIPGYVPSSELQNITETLRVLREDIGITAATQSSAALDELETINNDADAFAAASAASQADVTAATAVVQSNLDNVAATVTNMETQLADFNSSVAELRNATDTFIASVHVLNNITTAYAEEVDHWGREIADIPGDVADAVGDAVDALGLPSGLSGVGGIFGSILDFLIQAIPFVLIGLLLYFAISNGWFTKCCKKGSSGGGTKAAETGAMSSRARTSRGPKPRKPGGGRYGPVEEKV